MKSSLWYESFCIVRDVLFYKIRKLKMFQFHNNETSKLYMYTYINKT